MINKIKAGFSIQTFTILFVLLAFIGVCNVRGNIYYQYTGQYEEADIDNYIEYVQGYKNVDGVYEVVGEDPQINLNFSDSELGYVYGLKIKTKDNIDLSNVRIYFAEENQGYSEGNSSSWESIKDNTIDFLSSKKLTSIRVDVDCDYSIEEFCIYTEIEYEKIGNNIKYVYVILIALAISVIAAYIKFVNNVIDKILNIIKEYAAKFIRNYKRILVFALCCAGSGIVAVGYEVLKHKITDTAYINKLEIVWLFAIFVITSFVIVFKKYLMKYLHLFAFFVLMVIGTAGIIICPPIDNTSWDDEIHYGRTANLSWNNSNMISQEDHLISGYYYGAYQIGSEKYNREGREQWITLVNSMSNDYQEVVSCNSSISHVHVAYIPAAIGLNIGRGIGLKFTYVFMLGKFMNLLTYAIVFAIAISLYKNNRGRMIVALVGMIPTSIFLASSYSYDWWVIAFSVLGFSILFSKVQKNDTITVFDTIIAMLIVVIAYLPKAIYFPLIFPFLFINKKYFRNKKKSCAVMIIAMLALLATFMMPLLINGAGEGDLRGGSGVNSAEQISYILSNPLEYTDTLITFLKSYLSLDNSQDYLTFMAYCGRANYFTVCIVLLFMCTLMDNNASGPKLYKKGYVGKTIAFLSLFGTVALVATALYISFTPVGSLSIGGCQPRYILPILFMAMYIFGEVNISPSDKTKEKFIVISVLIMSAIYMIGINDLLVARY